MGIDINPSGVLRSADAVETAGQRAGKADLPAISGNDGFTTSEAIRQFSTEMHNTTALAGASATSTAEKLTASAMLMRRIDDDAAGATRLLWSRVSEGGVTR